MTVRIILFTGKGGVGKTTSAAGTAALAARAGHRTLVLSTDAAHSLGDAFGLARSGSEPVEVATDLWVHQVDAQRRFERSWGEIQGYLMSVLDAAGVDPITAEELTVIPGAEEVLALLELRNHVVSGEWDVVIVDCAPTAETLRLLALPEALGLVHDPGLRRAAAGGPGAAAGAQPGRRGADAGGLGLRRGRAAARRPRAGAADPHREGRHRPAGADARDRRRRRGAAVADHAVALRLPRRRRDRQPGLPARVAATPGARAGSRPSRRCSPRCGSPSPTCRSGARRTAPSEPVGVDALAEFAEAAYDGDDPLAVPESGEGPLTITRTEHRRRAAHRAARSPSGRTSTSPGTATSWS